MGHQDKTKIHSASGKVIGYVEGKVFHKYPLRGSVHKMRSPPGWGCDVRSLNEAKLKGAVSVHIFDEESDVHYMASLERFFTDGVFIDRGYDEQRLLPDKYWTVQDPRQPTLFGDAL